MKEFQLLEVQKTILNIHYPESESLKSQAIHRVFFDRLLRIQLFSLMNRLNYQSEQQNYKRKPAARGAENDAYSPAF